MQPGHAHLLRFAHGLLVDVGHLVAGDVRLIVSRFVKASQLESSVAKLGDGEK